MLSYKFRLYSTPQQDVRLAETLDGCRWVYNNFLALEPMSEFDMNYALTELKEQSPWLCNYHSKMLQMVGKQVSAARKALAALKKKGHRTGRLRYATHEEYNSFTYNQSGFKINGNKLWLSKIGSLKLVLHRQPVNIKQVTVVRQNAIWHVFASCQTLRRKYCMVSYSRPVGVDVGITKFAHDSNNNVVENPQFLTKMLKPLRRAHRRLSRRQIGSSNQLKARHMLARLYQRINNKRKDFLHKMSSYYAQSHDLIFVERLRVPNMVKNHYLARRIIDSGWRTFKQMLQYKANRLVEIDPRNTSINCSGCGNPVQKTLSVRTHRCNQCGLVIDRDFNSGMNILQVGLSLLCLPVERREVTPVEIMRRSLKQEAHVFKRG